MEDRIVRLISDVLKVQRAISPEKRLVEDLGLDSLRLIELITAVEDELGVSIPINRLASVRTVGDVHRLLAPQRNEDSMTNERIRST